MCNIPLCDWLSNTRSSLRLFLHLCPLSVPATFAITATERIQHTTSSRWLGILASKCNIFCCFLKGCTIVTRWLIKIECWPSYMKLRESRSGASYIKMERNGGKRNNNDKCRTRSKGRKNRRITKNRASQNLSVRTPEPPLAHDHFPINRVTIQVGKWVGLP